MHFEDFVRQCKVVRGRKDPQKAKAITLMSKHNLSAAHALGDKYPSVILTTSSDALRQVLEAICLSQGFKVYSHEAYTCYLKKIGEPAIAAKFDRFRKLRNDVQYYGTAVSIEVAVKARKEAQQLTLSLTENYLK